MSLTPTQECACRAVRDMKPGKHHVLLASQEEIKQVRNIVGVSLSLDSECYGSVWKSPTGELVSVHRYHDTPPNLEGGFELIVCNGGRDPTPTEKKDLERWRDASKA